MLDNIAENSLLKNDMVSFYYGKNPEKMNSKMILGGIDKSLAVGPIKYYDVIGNDYWAIKAENILLDGEDIGLCPNGCKLIFDTGTSLVTAPTDALRAMLPHLEVDDDCHNWKTLPTL